MDHQSIEAYAEAFAGAPRLAEMEIRSGTHGVIRFRRSLQDAEKKPRPLKKTVPAVPSTVASDMVTTIAVEAGGTVVTSSLVGIFRVATKNPVSVGSRINQDEALGSIEVMRLSNEVTAPIAGEITAVFVQDRQPVEYGQPLFEIKSEADE